MRTERWSSGISRRGAVGPAESEVRLGADLPGALRFAAREALPPRPMLKHGHPEGPGTLPPALVRTARSGIEVPGVTIGDSPANQGGTQGRHLPP